MSKSTVVRSIRAVCLVLAVALFAPLIAATPAQAAIVSFNCPSGGGTYQVNNGTLTGTTGTCSGDLVLDNSVVTINSSSLSSTSITSLTLPAGLTNYTRPFWYNTALTSISVAQGNSNFSSEDGVLFNANKTTLLTYPANKAGSTYSIPSSVTAIADYAFQANKNLTSIDIGSNVTYIGDFTFFHAYTLSVINIGAGLSYLGQGTFTYMQNLTAINVNQANAAFRSIDGVLYDIGISFLYIYPAAKTGTTFTAPSTVVQTGYMAFALTKNLITADLSPIGVMSEQTFMDSSSIQEVTYGNSISQIKSQTFQSATSLRRLNIGTSVTVIGGGAFYRNTSFSCVVYTGTNSTIQNYAYPNGVRPVTTGSSCLTAPAFTLSSSSEVVNAGSAISGYTINSTGGAIASFEISPAISTTPGLRFSTVTGLISETPTATAALRTYTITARNIVGTASQTFSVTVNPPPREVACGTGTYTVHMGIASAGSDCTGALVIASDVTEIATQAFLDAQITSLTLPTGLRTIRHLAFAGANLFPTLVIPNSVTVLESAAFQQGQFTSLTIGNGVTAIGEATFYRNYGAPINSITFGTGLTSIGYAAFQNFGVDRLTIPEGVTTLASRAFDGITSTVLVLPNSLTSVASDAFVYGNFSIVKYCGSNAAVTSYAFNVPIACGAIVDFNANTGSGTMSPSISSSNSALPANTFTRSGYLFNGWNTNSSGTGTSYAAGATFPYTTASNTTLYATWVPIAPAFTITTATENATAATAISGFEINSTGGSIASFSISPAIENGLSFNSATGLISGTPTNSALSKVYTITATNASGTASATYTIQVAQSAAQIAAAAEAARVAAEAAAAEAAEAKRIADAAAAARLAEQAANARIVAAAIAAAEAKRVADAAAEAKRLADIAAEAKRVADAAAEVKRLVEVAAEAKRIADEAAETKRLADIAAEAKRVADEAAETKRLADIAAEAKRVADAAVEAKRLADIAAEAKRVADAAAETKRRADAAAETKRLADAAAAETKRLADAAAKAKAQAQLDAQRALLTGTKKVSSIKKIAPKKAVVNLINLKPGTKIKITIKVGKK